MYRSLLVPLDGSLLAEHALPWALSIAEQDGVALHLVRIHIPPAPLMVGSEMSADMALDQTIRQTEIDYLEGLVKQLSAVATVPIRHALLEGAVADAIDDYAIAVKADLIVMTSHGRGAFVRFWLGSVADKIVRNSRTPVLLVRAHHEQAADLTTRPFIHRIVIPLDGSALAERIIEPAAKLGKAAGAAYSLLLVLDKSSTLGGAASEAAQNQAAAYLGRIVHRLRAESLLVDADVIQAAKAAEAILEFVAQRGNPVIALATHGRSGLQRLILGSVADKIIRGATMPVLIYHPMEKT